MHHTISKLSLFPLPLFLLHVTLAIALFSKAVNKSQLLKSQNFCESSRKIRILYVVYQYFTLALSTLRVACWQFFFFFWGKRPASNYQNSCLAQRLKGTKQKKWINYYSLNLNVITFVLLPAASEPNMNFNDLELASPFQWFLIQ